MNGQRSSENCLKRRTSLSSLDGTSFVFEIYNLSFDVSDVWCWRDIQGFVHAATKKSPKRVKGRLGLTNLGKGLEVNHKVSSGIHYKGGGDFLLYGFKRDVTKESWRLCARHRFLHLSLCSK